MKFSNWLNEGKDVNKTIKNLIEKTLKKQYASLRNPKIQTLDIKPQKISSSKLSIFDLSYKIMQLFEGTILPDKGQEPISFTGSFIYTGKGGFFSEPVFEKKISIGIDLPTGTDSFTVNL